MHQQKLSITIPKPCSESWTEMTPVEQGRFCAACQKTVVDYTAMSDAELIAAISSSASTGCGRYLPLQLGRALVPQARPWLYPHTGLFKRAAAALLFLQTVATTTWAQHTQARTSQQPATGDKITAKGFTIRGCVIDAITYEPLCGIEVQVKGTDIKTITGIAGTYQLQLPDTFHAPQLTLVAAYTEQSGKEPDGTTILSEVVIVDDLTRMNDVVLYRYPLARMNLMTATVFRKVIIESVITGDYAVEPIKPKSRVNWFWQKRKSNE